MGKSFGFRIIRGAGLLSSLKRMATGQANWKVHIQPFLLDEFIDDNLYVTRQLIKGKAKNLNETI